MKRVKIVTTGNSSKEEFMSSEELKIKTLPEPLVWENVGGDLYKLTNQIFTFKNFANYENNEDAFNKGIIPEGTRFWISEDLSGLYSEKMKITRDLCTKDPKRYCDSLGVYKGVNQSEKLKDDGWNIISNMGERTDLSFLYKDLCLDLLMTNGERMPWSPSINLNDVKGIFVEDDLIIGLYPLLKEVTISPENHTKTEDPEIAKNDFSKEKDFLDDSKSLYIPTCGELIKAFRKLFYINITRISLGLTPLYTNSYFMTRTLSDDNKIWGVYHTNHKSYLRGNFRVNGKKHEILPFIIAG